MDDSMSGAERAAVFLLSLGEEAAAAVLRHLDPMEVQNVGEAMTALSAVTSDKVARVVGEFAEKVQDDDQLLIGTEDYIRRMLKSALGDDKAKSMLGRILQSQNPKGLDALKWMEAKSVAGMLKNEHPQICAIVLLSLESEHAADILRLLPAEKRPEVIMRLANLDAINPDALEELNELMQAQLTESANSMSSRVDGIRTAAKILNHMDSQYEGDILDSIDDMDEELGDIIREKMIVFENLSGLDDRDLQRLLREIETEHLVLSLKAAEEPLKDKFFNNMSRRAAEMLREDIQLRGPVRLSEVEAAQKEILTVAARLAEEGEISFGNKGGEEYV